jgi:putative ABC transport system permease protein
VRRTIDRLRNDFTHALRSLRRRPGFSALSGATLAIGIGATTAIFSVINGVLLKPLDYRDPSGLVVIGVVGDEAHAVGNMSFPDLRDIRDSARSFEALVGYGSTNFTLTGRGDPEMVGVARLTEGLMQTFRVAPVLGRDVRREEFGPNAPNVAVLGNAAWVQRFGSDPGVIGSTVQLNSQSYQIVGVAPREFDFPGDEIMFWIPRQMDTESCARGCHTFNVIARLAPGATLERARAELGRLAANLEAAYPETNTGKRFVVRELKEHMVGSVKGGLWLMLGAVALVLLIACANVANLLLARASAREGETAVRSALGASRGMLARQVFAESAVLSLAGSVAGVALAFGGVAVLRRFAEGTIPRAAQIGIDMSVIVVTLGVVVLVTIAFSLIPALTQSRASLTENMSQVGRGGGTARRTIRYRRALLAGEVALSAALLIGAGLLLKTFSRMYAVDVGYAKEQIVRFRVTLPANDYPELERISQFYRSLETRLGLLPGVQAVGSMFGAPLALGQASGTLLVEGRPIPQPAEEIDGQIRPMTPGMMPALGLRLVRGRALSEADNRRDAEPVAMINESLARQIFPNEDPIGKRLRVTVDVGYGSPYWRIVGIVRDGRFDALTGRPSADMFLPHGQYGPNSMTMHVRLAPGATLTPTMVRDAVRAVDPGIPIYRYEAIEDVIGQQVAPTRLYLLLVGAFALTAAALAAVGLFGVMSFVVAQRTREIGIRVALGSRRSGVVGLVVRQGMEPVLLGVVVGVAGAIVAGRFVTALLFEVQPSDPLVLLGAAALMVVVALIASAAPAARASGIQPARVLHGDQ